MNPIKGGKHPQKKNEVDETLKSIAGVLKDSSGKPKPNTTGISYSGLLLQLVEPYQQVKGSIPVEELEYLLDIGVAAWNLSVCKMKNEFLYQSYLGAVKGSDGLDKTGERLLNKLVADKERFFGQYNDMLLEDFEITEDKKGLTVVNVLSKSVDAFLQEALNGNFEKDLFEPAHFANENLDEDDMPSYVLPVVNRNVVIIKPKTRFLDWLRKIYFPQPPPLPYSEFNVYLLPEYETEKEVKDHLRKNFDRIFCSELWGCNTDEKTWPVNRTYKMFTDWFDAKMQCMIYDTANYPLQRE